MVRIDIEKRYFEVHRYRDFITIKERSDMYIYTYRDAKKRRITYEVVNSRAFT